VVRNELPSHLLDKIVEGDATHLDLPSDCIDLTVTSPPYNVEMPYANYKDCLEFAAYKEFLLSFLKEQFRVLVPGGRLCVNHTTVYRRPLIPWIAYIEIMATEEIGFLIRGEIRWKKETGCCDSTTWGSWLSPSNPYFRGTGEYIVVFTKPNAGETITDQLRMDVPPGPYDIKRDEFLRDTTEDWPMKPETAIRWHPAAFPEELPSRLIKLLTAPGQLIHDPFSGSGTTALAAKHLGRHFICVDKDPSYVKKSNQRLLLES
jgi:site-specific DNA-methyltransferase (adenine-specific)